MHIDLDPMELYRQAEAFAMWIQNDSFANPIAEY
jgi:hypothetical protein